MKELDKLLNKKFTRYENKEDGYSLDIPLNWMHISNSDDFGDTFSDKDKQEGMLAVKITSSLFHTLDQFADALATGLNIHDKNKLISRQNIVVANFDAIEMSFNAKADVGAKEKEAIMITCIVHDPKVERFVFVTYSALKENYPKLKSIYEQAKKSLKLID
ncbi:MAG: PsbP-related protein [Candidatus Micrarchaeota archaeon]